MELTRRYRVSGVPKTIINGKAEILGAVPEDAFVDAVVSGTTTPEQHESDPGPLR
jgi:predicted DsbA family dithiol-disulfide isomerase